MAILTNSETVKEIKDIISQNPGEGSMVRVYVAGMGWSGPSFGIALDERKDDDEYFEFDGQGFVIESDLSAQFGDILVEYQNGGYIVQPAASAGGCSSCAGSCG